MMKQLVRMKRSVALSPPRSNRSKQVVDLFEQLLKKAALLRSAWSLQHHGLQLWTFGLKPIESQQGFASPFQVKLKNALIDLRAVVRVRAVTNGRHSLPLI
jgi:hypothetical protein